MKKRLIFLLSFFLLCMLTTTAVYGQTKKVVRQKQAPVTQKSVSAAASKPKTQSQTSSKQKAKPSPFSVKQFVADGFNFIILNPSEVAVTPSKDSDYKGHLRIPEKVNYNGKEYKVVKVGHSIYHKTKSYTKFQIWGFYYDNDFTSVTIPYGITTINERAFMNCENLASVSIPNSVTTIEDQAFERCGNLSSIVIPNSVKHIGWSAFSSCDKLASVTIPQNGIYIHPQAFSFSCDKLEKALYTSDLFIRLPPNYQGDYKIPEGIKTVAYAAFNRCENLTSVTIPSSVTKISSCAFRFCSSLTSVVFPEGIKGIPSSTFEYCCRLTDITIPNSVTYIGEDAFANCSQLTNIRIPDNVKEIGKHAFWDCEALHLISIPESLIDNLGDGIFDDCDNLRSVTVRYPDGREGKIPLKDKWKKS